MIIPVKNEPALGGFLPAVHEVLASIPDQYEVLVVQGDKETKFYPYPEFPQQQTIWTYGDSLERSILNGFSHAKGDKIIVMDADFSHPPTDIVRIWKGLDAHEMVVGTRFAEGSEFTSSPFRRLVSWGCILLAKSAGTKLSDPMSGFFGVRRELLKKVKFRPITWKTCLEIELKAKPKLAEIPITFVERTEGESKTTLKVGLKIIKELLVLNYEQNFGKITKS